MAFAETFPNHRILRGGDGVQGRVQGRAINMRGDEGVCVCVCGCGCVDCHYLERERFISYETMVFVE